MASSNHFLSTVFPALEEYSDRIIFRPYLGNINEWGAITFGEWKLYIEAASQHWLEQLKGLDLKTNDVIGVWLTGSKWTDLINTSSISALGYVPELFSTHFAPEIIFSLLGKSGGKAIIYDTSSDVIASAAAKAPVPTFAALTEDFLKSQVASGNVSLKLSAENLPAVSERDPAKIVHSSGTTSGMPKLIPVSHLLLKKFVWGKLPGALLQGKYDTPSVINSLGNLNHVGSFQAFHGAAVNGCTTVQASSMAPPTEELAAMIKLTGLNRLVQYATFLSVHIRNAQKDEQVKKLLQSFRQILHTGVALNREDENWAYDNGLKVTTMYGTSETAPLLTSFVGTSESDRLLHPVAGASPQFIPFNSSEAEDSTTNGDANSQRSPLYELVVAHDAPDAPPAPFIEKDGFWHTNDLFEEITPKDGGEKGWVYRGRCGDWIKTMSGFVDTKTIEDTVRRECPDIVFDAVIVGTNLPYPCLVVESAVNGLSTEEKAKVSEQVVARTAHLNDGLFHYERVKDPERVIVVDKGTLPRTKEKGNIRRAATEELLKGELDAIFA